MTDAEMDAIILNNLHTISMTERFAPISEQTFYIHGKPVPKERIERVRRWSSGACVNCNYWEHQHIDKKCPFGPKNYRRIEPIVERAQVTRIG